MEIKLYTNKDFKKEYQPLLNQFETELQLWFRNLDDSKELTKDEIRGGIYIDNKLSLLFLNAYPFNLQLFSLNDDIRAFEYLINYIIKNNININGTQGNLKDSEIFKDIYYKLSKQKIHQHYKMDILKLDNLNEINCNGSIERANEENINLLIEYYDKFTKEAMGEEVEKKIIKDKIITELNEIYVYKNSDGKITSCVKTIECLPNGASLTFVYTDKDERNKGYAKEMLYLICKVLLKKYKYLTLFVDQTNPISNKVYKDIGFNLLISNYDYRLND